MNDTDNPQNLIIYHTADGKAAVSLYARDGNVWMNQSQLAELFATSKQNISLHSNTSITRGSHRSGCTNLTHLATR